MKRILISISILVIVSTTFALIFCDKTLFSFLKYFLSATVVQFIIQYFVNQFLNAKYGVQIAQLESILASESNKNIKSIACPCFIKNVQDVNIDLNGDNKYVCDKCKKPVSVIIDVSTALATVPADELKTIKPITIKPTNE